MPNTKLDPRIIIKTTPTNNRGITKLFQQDEYYFLFVIQKTDSCLVIWALDSYMYIDTQKLQKNLIHHMPKFEIISKHYKNFRKEELSNYKKQYVII